MITKLAGAVLSRGLTPEIVAATAADFRARQMAEAIGGLFVLWGVASVLGQRDAVALLQFAIMVFSLVIFAVWAQKAQTHYARDTRAD